MINNDLKLQPLIVSPTPLNFGVVQQDSSATLVISNPNNKPILWHVDTYGTKWLSLDKATTAGELKQKGKPGAQQEFKVTINTNSMPAGSYTATLTFTADVDDEFASVQVPVRLTVSSVRAGELIVAASPLIAGLSFVRFLSSSQTLPLAITNWDSQNSVDWKAEIHGTNWLTVDRWEGVLQANERQTLYVTANTDSLHFGDYLATLNLKVANTQTPVQMQVELHVDAIPDGDNGPKAPIVSPTRLDFGTVESQASLLITNPGPPLNDQAVKLTMDNRGKPWLKLDGNTAIAPIILQPNGTKQVTVTIDRTRPAGPYSTDLMPTFTFANPALGNEPAYTLVPVTMTVS